MSDFIISDFVIAVFCDLFRLLHQKKSQNHYISKSAIFHFTFPGYAHFLLPTCLLFLSLDHSTFYIPYSILFRKPVHAIYNQRL